MLTEIGIKTFEIFKELRDAPEKMAGAWRSFAGPMKLTNDELAVSLDKVNMEIEKLEGKRRNTLKLMLDEAKVSADKLASSLDKTFRELAKVLEENKPGWIARTLGEGSTYNARMMAGGFTGTAGIQTKLEEAGRPATLKIAQAKTEAESLAAQKELDISQQKVLNAELADTVRLLDEAKKRALPAKALNITGDKPVMGVAGGEKQGLNISALQMQEEAIRKELARIDYESQLRTANRRKESLEAQRENEALERPFENKIAKLKADLSAITLKLSAVGMSDAEKAIAKAGGEAIKSLEEINKLRKVRFEAPLGADSAEAVALRALHLKIATTEAEETWLAKVIQASLAIKDQVRSQELLTEAIGKGYAAVKAATVETQLMGKFTPDERADPRKQFAVSSVRTQLGAEYDAQKNRATAETTDRLGDQIALERSLAQVQIEGAEAIRLVTLAYRLREITMHGVRSATGELSEATRKQITEEIKLYEETRKKEAATDLAKVNERIVAVQRLTDAQLKGAEAVRLAGLENKYAAMRDLEGKTPEVIAATRTEDAAAHEEQITAKVAARVNVFKNELDALNDEKGKLLEILMIHGATADTVRALRDIEDARLKIIVQQTLAQRGAMDGVRAFFQEMQQQAKSAAEIIYESLNSALDRTSDNLAKVLTGQKTEWAKMFQGIGEEMLKSTIKSGLQKELGELGKAFPGVGKILDKFGIGEKPDGSSATKALWVRMTGAGGGSGTQSGRIDGILNGNGGLLGTGRIPKFEFGMNSGAPTLGGGPDGSPSNPFFVVVSEGGTGKPSGGNNLLQTMGAGVLTNAIIGGLSKFSGALGSKSGKYGGGKASGGDVFAGETYMTGEEGPELFRSGVGGHIYNAAQTRSMFSGGDIHYHVDARGATDPYLTRQQVEAGIKAAHNSSVVMSIRANHDRAQRVPAPGHA